MLVAAAVAGHGLLAGGAHIVGGSAGPEAAKQIVQRAFEIGEEFIAEAERRFGKLPFEE